MADEVKKTNGKRNRSAGNGWERKLAEIFRKIGFVHVVTTRSESRSRDNQKIDLINKDEGTNGRLPYDIQAKNLIGHVKYGKVMDEMQNHPTTMPVIIHRQTEKANEKFVVRNDFAILYLDDFLTLVQQRDERKPTWDGLAHVVKGRARKAVLQTTNKNNNRRVQQI